MNKQAKEEYFRKLEGDIARNGFATVTVFEKDSNHKFTYSVGLHKTYGHPEIITFGLPGKIAHAVIGDIAAKAKEDKPFDLSEATKELFEGEGEVVFLKVSKEVASKYLLSAFWFNNEEDFEVFQVVWKSQIDCAYPWDEGASSDFIDIQPIVGEER
ncbi:DUF4262 domain-containing protein [Luteolibacter pohnpeiensis]|uniref:DUF4262 domain-containing protein n=1 Tax=Luteolibacter pohnpeiensis TaxID=454153 RepID=A0A934SB11_9BACT|nr:DUF4262 domain-containing protein [Luteolibacter pohnpeiensis]MBK1884700.1 DUF4262 domain-containing protein [Luteolibacter pohnpeiensis]